jgi:hypothetical protein
MSADDYKVRFGIPYSYTLSCARTAALHAAEAFARIESGLFRPSPEQAARARAAKKNRPPPPVRAELTRRNLARMNAGKTGEATAYRKTRPKRGTEAYHEMMRNRPQVSKAFGAKMRAYWTGREQSPEHVLKRTGYPKKA